METQEQTIEKPEEQPIKKMHPHVLGFFGYYFFGIILAIVGVVSFFYMALLGAVVFLVGIIILMTGELHRRAETFYVWENGVEREYKMLSSTHKFVEYHNIQNMEVNQSFLQNIFNIGDMEFNTAGGSGKEEVMVFRGIKEPHEIERIVQERMKKD